jgi:ubiquinone/menaquinone biosynthesis C-methylase UbiE
MSQSASDQCVPSREPAAGGYDPIADWYAASVHSGSPVHALAMPALLDLAGEVSGLHICDIACGAGVAARALAERGARVTGVDLCESLLAIGRAEELRNSRSVSYVFADAQRLDGVDDASFDAAVCSLALMDIPDLDCCLDEAARIVRPHGWLVFTITHPCFQTPESRWTGKAGGTVKREVRGYFREGHWRSDNPDGVRGRVGAYHRTLSTYVAALAHAGWTIEAMREPQPTDEVSARVPGYAEAAAVLAVRCRNAY